MCVAAGAHAQDTAATAHAAQPYSASAHDALIVARREGRATSGEVLSHLQGWLATVPGTDAARPRLVSDAVAVAAELARACDAAEISRSLPLDRLLDYALAPLTAAARHCPDSTLQGEVIQVWRTRMPDAREPRLQEAFWWLDTGDLPGAQRLQAQLAVPAPTERADRVGLLELQAALARASGQPLVALARYRDLLALAPEHGYARRQAVLLLAAGGGASVAWTQALAQQQAHPGTFTALELASLRQDALGQQMRWAIAERDRRLGAQRTRPIDEVLAQLAAALEAAEIESARDDPAQAPAWAAVRQRLQWDRSLGELERGRPAAALDLHDALAKPGVPVPFQAQVVAARSLARLGRPHEAARLYESALEQAPGHSPDTWAARQGLIYAYADAGRFDDAQALLDRMKAQTPPYRRLAPQAQTPNQEYSALHAIEADLLLMGDRIEAARTRFARLSTAAGMNTGFRAGAATASIRSEQPGRAIAQFQALLADDPQGISSRADMAEAWMHVNEWRAARELVQTLAVDAPDDGRVQRLQMAHAAATGPRLEIDASGESGNLATASRVWQIDSRLSSGLINDAWRVHAGYARAQGDDDAGLQRNWQRAALGMRWAQGRWQAQAQLQHANAGPHRNSIAAGLDLRISDRWRLALRHDGDSPQTPWRARSAHIGARSTDLQLDWVLSERRRFTLGQSRLDLSDRNVRNGTQLQWRERWLSTPRLQMESALSAGRGGYRQQDRPYFSPSGDSQLQASVRAQWLSWRAYERIFFQGVELSAGSYRQDGFGSGSTWSLRYGHRWVLGPRAELSYGLSVGSHPYDGRRERQRRAYLQLSVPL